MDIEGLFTIAVFFTLISSYITYNNYMWILLGFMSGFIVSSTALFYTFYIMIKEGNVNFSIRNIKLFEDFSMMSSNFHNYASPYIRLFKYNSIEGGKDF